MQMYMYTCITYMYLSTNVYTQHKKKQPTCTCIYNIDIFKELPLSTLSMCMRSCAVALFTSTDTASILQQCKWTATAAPYVQQLESGILDFYSLVWHRLCQYGILFDGKNSQEFNVSVHSIMHVNLHI